jgi:hypothetical protein
MVPDRRHYRLALTALATLAFVSAGQVARGQDDVVVEDDATAPAGGRVATVDVPRVHWVDQFLFGGQDGARDNFRNKFHSLLRMRIDEIERSCGLTAAQKRKLCLAGTADIKRFFDRVDEIKRDPKDNNNGVVVQKAQPLVIELQSGLFGAQSLLAKTIKKTLSEDQAAELVNSTRQQKLRRYEAAVGWYVFQLNKTLGLSEEHRQRLVDTIVKETRPPRRYDQWLNWYVLNQAASISEDKVAPIFDEIQWQVYRRLLSQAKQWATWLEQNGIVPDDTPLSDPPSPAPTRARPSGSTIKVKAAELDVKASPVRKNNTRWTQIEINSRTLGRRAAFRPAPRSDFSVSSRDENRFRG